MLLLPGCSMYALESVRFTGMVRHLYALIEVCSEKKVLNWFFLREISACPFEISQSCLVARVIY